MCASACHDSALSERANSIISTVTEQGKAKDQLDVGLPSLLSNYLNLLFFILDARPCMV
jgi:hypothetical protein